MYVRSKYAAVFVEPAVTGNQPAVSKATSERSPAPPNSATIKTAKRIKTLWADRPLKVAAVTVVAVRTRGTDVEFGVVPDGKGPVRWMKAAEVLSQRQVS